MIDSWEDADIRLPTNLLVGLRVEAEVSGIDLGEIIRKKINAGEVFLSLVHDFDSDLVVRTGDKEEIIRYLD